jgi:DNA-binding CsgD family transcriptional regulator
MIAAESMDGVACIAGAEGTAERAAKLFGAAWALRESLGHRQAPRVSALRETYQATTRSRLDEASWEAAWDEGRTMAFAEAVKYALSAVEPSSPVSEQAPTGTRPTLTRREEEVASLVVRGLTNRQIASELVVSEHTVHHHVTNILKKLNLRSREQVRFPRGQQVIA